MALKQIVQKNINPVRCCSLSKSLNSPKPFPLYNLPEVPHHSVCPNWLFVRWYNRSSIHLQVKQQRDQEITVASEKKQGEITFAKKVAQAGEDATYTGIVIVGIGVTGMLFYVIGRELFSSQSSSGLYASAYKQCCKNQEVIDELGDKIKGQGEMDRRGRARHVSHIEFEKDGVKHMRMKFYLKGSLRNGTAHLEMIQDESGKYITRYLFVEVDKYPYKTIVIEDNR